MAQEQDVPEHGNGARQQQESGPQNPQQLNSELAKAFQELARGEQTASALENRLDGIESRIEQLLASVEQSARETGSAGSEQILTNRSGSKESQQRPS